MSAYQKIDQQITADQLVEIFNQLFRDSENTVLVDGQKIGELEPLYVPATETEPAKIIFAHGFVTSACHEIAHWCYAGKARRKLVDYGYWYAGDDRNQEQQDTFEKVEVIPQAYELILSKACGIPFKVSLDNFNPDVQLDRDAFTKKVEAMAEKKEREGMSERLRVLVKAVSTLKLPTNP